MRSWNDLRDALNYTSLSSCQCATCTEERAAKEAELGNQPIWTTKFSPYRVEVNPVDEFDDLFVIKVSRVPSTPDSYYFSREQLCRLGDRIEDLLADGSDGW
jgi:hypothetical protein